MPELPEAETIARSLAPRLEGRRIVDVEFFARRAHGGRPPEVAGRRIRRVRRYGKQVMIELDRGLLFVRLGMTGSLLLRAGAGPYTRARFTLDQGTLCFDDVRQFGSIRLMDRPPEHLGPDPLEIPATQFVDRLRGRRAQVKRLLLDQSFLRGIGNIYADEILFRARMHPKAVAARISPLRARRLHRAIVEILSRAIKKGGSSISDYVDGEGRQGFFQIQHKVYGKQGTPCQKCGAIIRRIVVAQRGTHYCPTCQRI